MEHKYFVIPFQAYLKETHKLLKEGWEFIGKPEKMKHEYSWVICARRHQDGCANPSA